MKQPVNSLGDPAKIVGIVFSSIATLFFFIALWLFQSGIREAQNAIHIEGTVVRLEENNDGLTAPVVEYRYNGKKQYHVGEVWSSPPAWEEGERATLLIDPSDETNVSLDNWLDRHFMAFILMVFALVFGGIGFALLYYFR